MCILVIKTLPEESALMRSLPSAYFLEEVQPKVQRLVADACSTSKNRLERQDVTFEQPMLGPLTRLAAPIELVLVTIGDEERVAKFSADENALQKVVSKALLQIFYQGGLGGKYSSMLMQHEVTCEHYRYLSGGLQFLRVEFTNPAGGHY